MEMHGESHKNRAMFKCKQLMERNIKQMKMSKSALGRCDK